MESETIADEYIILKKEDSGGTAKVFLVKGKDSEEVNIAKVLKEKYNNDNVLKGKYTEAKIENKKYAIFAKKCFINEVKILKFLKERIDNSYIVNYIDSGEGQVKRIGHPITKNRYLILGYEKKGCLFDYIYFPKSGFPEEYSKVIFYKILMGLKAIHSQNICHRDIKLENILVDEKYNPKICDFGFSTYNKDNLKNYLGTKGFRSPQIVNNKPYNGFKNDIFSLGQTLIFLVTGYHGYENDAEEDNLLYYLIKSKDQYYWKILEKVGFQELTPEFKELYFDLLAYSEDKRPEIKDILESKWMKDISSKIKDLEPKIRQEFERRENIIIEKKASEVEIKKESSELGTMRSGGSLEDKNNFNYNSNPYDIKNEKHFDNFIIIKSVLNPATLMNELKNKLLINYGNKCDVTISNEKKLKFHISFDKEKGKTEEIFEKMREEYKKLNINEIKFENKNENSEENKNNEEKGEIEEDEEENYDIIIDEEKSKIDAKLFKIKDNEYLLSFTKKEGGLEEFYNNIQKITEQVKNIN